MQLTEPAGGPAFHHQFGGAARMEQVVARQHPIFDGDG